MSVDVSTLAIQVTSTGIKDASSGLTGLGTAAANAETKVTSLTSKLSTLMQTSSSLGTAANGLSGTMGLIVTAMQSAATNAAALAQSLASTTQGMNTLTQQTNASTSALDSHSRSGHVVRNTLEAMATAALAYFSIGTAKSVVTESDAWGMMQAKLKLATGSMIDAKEVQAQLFDMAQKTRVPLEDLGKLYGRLAPALQRMGKTSDDVKNMVEGMTLALKLGGATGAEAASTMLQFSQAANAGRLNGAEFNSVAENGVLILRALEDYTGKTSAELKKMGAQGALTFDIISAAMDAALPKWRRDFESLPLTFEGAMERIKNAWFKALGEVGQDTELGKKLAETVLKLEKDIPRVAEVVVKALVFILDNLKPILAALTALAAFGFVKWGLEAVAAFSTVSLAIGGATGALTALRVAAGFLLGPWGALAAMLTGGITLWSMYGNAGEEASDKVTKKVTVDVDKRIAALEREIEKMEERNKVAAAGLKIEGSQALEPAAQQMLDRIAAINKELAAPSTTVDMQSTLMIELGITQASFERLMNDKERLKVLSAQRAEEEKQKKINELNDKYKGQVGTPQQQASLKMEKADAEYKALGMDAPDWVLSGLEEKKTHGESQAEKEAKRQIDAAKALAANVGKLKEETEFLTLKMNEQHSSTVKLTAAEQMQATIDKLRKETTNALALAILNKMDIQNQEVFAIERLNEGLKNQYKLREDSVKTQNEQIGASEKEIASLQDKIAEYGKLKGSAEDAALAAAKGKLGTMQSFDDGSDGNGEIARQKQIIANLEQIANLKKQLNGLELGDKIKKEIDAIKPADFGRDFASAFGKVGTAIDVAGKSLDTFSKRMIAVNELRKDAEKMDKEKNPAEYAAAVKAANEAELRSTVNMYGDMAGAMKSFFGEKTIAHKAFAAIEQGIRITQMALLTQETAFKQAAYIEEVAAKAAAVSTGVMLDQTSTASSVSSSIAKTGASVTAGVAKMFEVLGPFGFAAAAGMLAFMATVGFSGGGGGGAPAFDLAARQKSQGTGTMLGDEGAQSDSMKKSLSDLASNSNIGLTYTSEMLVSLRNIDEKMGSVASSISRVAGLRTGKNFGIEEGKTGGMFSAIPVIGTVLDSIFGGGSSTTIDDTGLTLKGRINDLKNGGVQQYVDTTTTEQGGLFGGGGTSHDRATQGVSQELSKYIGDVFDDVDKTIITAGTKLGFSAEDLKRNLEQSGINTEVSLKGLSGTALESALSAVFSAASDDLAMAAVPYFTEFQKVGEGYFQTLVRVASGVEIAQNALTGLGVSMVALWQVENKTGNVDAELVRSSLIRKEAGTSLENILRLLGGTMTDLIASYKELTSLRSALTALNLGDISLDLIRGAGGVKELTKAFGDYLKGFYTKQEQGAVAMADLNMEFSRLGLQVPATKDAFRALVTQLQAGGASGQEMAGRVLGLSQSWIDATTAMETSKAADLATAKTELKDAYTAEANELTKVRDKMLAFSTSLKELHDTLIGGTLSPKTAMEKYQFALASYNDTSTKAQAGDEVAIGKFAKDAEELLKASRAIYASGTAYSNDFNRVMSETDAVQKIAAMASATADTQLTLLKTQIDALGTINASVLSVAAAIAQLQFVQANGFLPPAVNGSHAGGLTSVPFDGYIAELHKDERVLTAAESKNYSSPGQDANAALVAEIAALRAEVTALKEQHLQGTNAIIASNYDANEANAKTVVEGTKGAMVDSAYVQRTQIGLN